MHYKQKKVTKLQRLNSRPLFMPPPACHPLHHQHIINTKHKPHSSLFTRCRIPAAAAAARNSAIGRTQPNPLPQTLGSQTLSKHAQRIHFRPCSDLREEKFGNGCGVGGLGDVRGSELSLRRAASEEVVGVGMAMTSLLVSSRRLALASFKFLWLVLRCRPEGREGRAPRKEGDLLGRGEGGHPLCCFLPSRMDHGLGGMSSI